MVHSYCLSGDSPLKIVSIFSQIVEKARRLCQSGTTKHGTVPCRDLADTSKMLGKRLPIRPVSPPVECAKNVNVCLPP